MPNTQLYNKYLELVLAYVRRFMDMSEDEFSVLIPYFEIRSFEKKALVLRAGEIDNYFNIIMKGLARKYLPTRKKEITTQIGVEGQMIYSEISFNLRQPSMAVIEALEPLTLLSISFDNIQQIYERHPKMEKLARLIIIDMFIRKDKRKFRLLNTSTRQRFLDYVNDHPAMVQRVPQKYLASYLNIKPETFSRLKHLLRPKKLANADS